MSDCDFSQLNRSQSQPFDKFADYHSGLSSCYYNDLQDEPVICSQVPSQNYFKFLLLSQSSLSFFQEGRYTSQLYTISESSISSAIICMSDKHAAIIQNTDSTDINNRFTYSRPQIV